MEPQPGPPGHRGPLGRAAPAGRPSLSANRRLRRGTAGSKQLRALRAPVSALLPRVSLQEGPSAGRPQANSHFHTKSENTVSRSPKRTRGKQPNRGAEACGGAEAGRPLTALRRVPGAPPAGSLYRQPPRTLGPPGARGCTCDVSADPPPPGSRQRKGGRPHISLPGRASGRLQKMPRT